jgi:hypothetical protein
MEEAMPGHLSTVTPFASDLLTNTEWKNLSDAIIGVLFPNFFIVYFRQDFPKGDISSDDIKVNFAKLGAGYSLWISAAAEAIEKKEDIREVLCAVAKNTSYSRTDFIKSHFFPYYDPSKSLPIASGPYSLISIVDSDLFPVETDELQIFFPSSDHFPTSRCALGLEHFDSTTTK